MVTLRDKGRGILWGLMNDLVINPDTGELELRYDIEIVRQLIHDRLTEHFNAIQSARDSISLPTVKGKDLDKLAELWGINRKYMETDDELRHRTRALAVDDGYLGIELPQGFIEMDGAEVDFGSGKIEKSKGPTCECGSAALGYTQPGPGHASYCPLATK